MGGGKTPKRDVNIFYEMKKINNLIEPFPRIFIYLSLKVFVYNGQLNYQTNTNCVVYATITMLESWPLANEGIGGGGLNGIQKELHITYHTSLESSFNIENRSTIPIRER